MRHEALMREMIRYEAGVPHRIQHFLKVYEFARLIAAGENLDDVTRDVLEAAAIVHDIGIKPAMEKYGSGAGPLQEKEGEPAARTLLTRLGYAPDLTERVAYLVAHHHTYDAIDGMDYQILVEADFLVNLHESADRYRAILAEERIFRTESGKRLLRALFGIE